MPSKPGSAGPGETASLLDALHERMQEYEELYKHLHRNPELSNCEDETSQLVADRLRRTGVFDQVHTHIGGYGVAGVWKNGPGRTLMIRSDMDALPVREQTGLPYASEVEAPDDQGQTKPVMHACGHDIHMTCLLAAVDFLKQLQDRWYGTLIVVFQQAEERGTGAQAMVDGGLYDRVPVPDLLIGQHVMPLPAGRITWLPGVLMGACDSFKVTLHGSGGHGSTPQNTVDPVVMACNLVTRLQTIVSREVDPQDVAVVTVGTIHAGNVENIISDSAEVGVDIRSVNEATRAKVIAAVKRMVHAEYIASGAVREPDIVRTRTFPPTDNDPEAARQLEDAFRNRFGGDFSPKANRVLMAEDVSILATSQGKPCLFWHLGGIERSKYEAAAKAGTLNKDIPGNHSARFAPVIRPTLDAGIDALCLAVLTYLSPPS